jgi:hypothetical protein
MPTVLGRAETDLLCACARRRAQISGPAPLSDTNVDWNTLLGAANTHGVTELLLAPLTSAGLRVPPSVLTHLEQRSIEVTGVNLQRATEVAGLLQTLSDHGVRALTFKGPALAVGVYGHLGRRFSGDIDVFVDRRDIERVRPLLLELGYRVPPRAPRRRGSLLYGLIPSAGRDDMLWPGQPWQTFVDVHVAFASWRFGIRLEPQALFERAITLDVAGQRLTTLCPNDLLLVLAIHGMMHCWLTLRLVSDIDAVADLVTDWDDVMSRAEAAGMRRVLWVALLLAERLLGTALPPHVGARAAQDPDARRIALGAAAKMFDADTRPDPKRRAWLRSFLDDPRRRFTFVVRDTIHEWFLIWPWNTRPGRWT